MWIIYPLIFFAGFVDSIAGGGGLISLTSYFAIGVPPHMALGTNKVSAFLGTGLSAAYFARKGYVHWGAAFSSFVGALAGSALGAHIALLLEARTITLCMLIIIPIVAAVIILKKDMGYAREPLGEVRIILYAAVVGFVIGMYDGFIGPGTGTFLIMAFTMIVGFDLLTACGNAKVVNFASNIAAAITFMNKGEVDFGLAIPCALCAILGNFVGTRLAIRNGIAIVRPMMLFVIAMLLVKVGMDLFAG